MPAPVQRQVIRRFAFELLQHLLIITLHPARGIDVDILVDRLDLVLIAQAVGDHFVLQHTHRTHHDIVIAAGEKNLGRALLGQLLQALLQLLGLQGVTEADTAKQLRRKVGHTGILECLALTEGIANLDGAVVVQTDNIAGNCLFHHIPLPRLEVHRIGNPDVLAQAYMAHLHTAVVGAGANAHKGDTIPVLGIHIGLDFENKPRKRLFVGIDQARDSGATAWPGSPFDKIVEHFPHPEIG